MSRPKIYLNCEETRFWTLDSTLSAILVAKAPQEPQVPQVTYKYHRLGTTGLFCINPLFFKQRNKKVDDF